MMSTWRDKVKAETPASDPKIMLKVVREWLMESKRIRVQSFRQPHLLKYFTNARKVSPKTLNVLVFEEVGCPYFERR